VYRDQFIHCPACGAELKQAGSVWRCDGCSGCWVEERILADMVLRMRDGEGQSAIAFEPRATSEAARGCPRCRDRMDPVVLHAVELERCAKHGIWFDAKELQVALQRAGESKPAHENWVSPDLRPETDDDWGFWGSFWDPMD
jgi:Zn-finger nucleic acid-binding protein